MLPPQTYLPPSLRHEPFGGSVPPIRSDHLHGPAPLLVPFTDRTGLVGAERRRGGGVAREVVPREGDQFGEVVDPEDGAARLDERVEESAQVAGAGTCEKRGKRWRCQTLLPSSIRESALESVAKERTDVEDIGSRFQERFEVLDSAAKYRGV